jgi:hypothetical protein
MQVEIIARYMRLSELCKPCKVESLEVMDHGFISIFVDVYNKCPSGVIKSCGHNICYNFPTREPRTIYMSPLVDITNME